MPSSGFVVRRARPLTDADISGLADVLKNCVDDGASVSFMQPFSRARAVEFFTDVAHGVANGDRALLIAEDPTGVIGTVQLVLAQPDNQPHRADVSKMLVHTRARNRGVGAALMQAAEAMARNLGRTLLVLDTASASAERLYERAGWIRVGVVPGFALLPHGGLCDTVFYYRQLD
jgi:GNAT superfamily N-acetyltransferase